MSEEQSILIEYLEQAVNAVYREGRFLFNTGEGSRRGLEQAFVFRVGIYLNQILQNSPYSELDLDSEYNKNQDDIKCTVNFPKGVRPDLLLHKRDSNDHNKLVVEFKGWWNKNTSKDIQKLKDLTNPNADFKYTIGVFVRLYQYEPTYRYFENGDEII